MKFFDCFVKFWTLLYSSKTQWSNSQEANFIGFKQGQFWSPYMCTFHLAYFKSGCQFMRVRPHQGRTVRNWLFYSCPPLKEIENITWCNMFHCKESLSTDHSGKWNLNCRKDSTVMINTQQNLQTIIILKN